MLTGIIQVALVRVLEGWIKRGKGKYLSRLRELHGMDISVIVDKLCTLFVRVHIRIMVP